MFSSVNVSAISPIIDIAITVIVLMLVPAAWFFHRKVIRPLSWMLGLKAEQSPTGEAVLTIPQQLAELRQHQTVVVAEVASIKAEVNPNGGGSLRDSTDRNEKMTREIGLHVVDLQSAFDKHMVEERQSRDAISELALKTAGEVALLVVATAKDVKVAAEANASSVARLATDTAADVKSTAEHNAEDVASLAVDTALLLRHRDD